MELVEPRPFQEGWDHPEIKQCMKWREAIRKEFSDMNKQQVWHKIIRDKIPKGRRCVKYKWVFKTKRNGIFHACLVAAWLGQPHILANLERKFRNDVNCTRGTKIP